MFRKKQEQPKPTVPQTTEDQSSKSEALFHALEHVKKAKRRKLIRLLILIFLLLIIVTIAGIGILRRQVREQFAGKSDEVTSEKATRGFVSTVVSGSGMLLNVDTETVSVPAGVEVTEILVEFGDEVKEGDLLALADMATVRSAMATLQEEIAELDDQITDAEGDSVSKNVTAGVPGRIKILYAEAGMSVEDIMVEHGGLAVISLDGYMAVQLETDVLKPEETVTVVLSDGTEKTGSVSTVVAGKATILVTDNGPVYDEEVTIKTASGQVVGSGKLYIHNPLMVTGYAGMIKSVKAKLNQKVSSSTKLFMLTETATSATYDALLRSRSEKEETLLELLQLQRYGGPISPINGSIFTVADLSDDADTETEEATDIATISPDISMSVTISVDESDILSLALEQMADVVVRSIGDEVRMGTVTEIDKTDSSGAYTAVVTLDKTEGMLPGMTAEVDIRIEGVDNAVLIPADALQQSASGYYVYTMYDEETGQLGGRVDVIPGLSNSNYVEIKSGLQEGDTVYYTESADFFSFRNMPGGGMPNMGGGMPNNSGNGNRPSGSNRPDSRNRPNNSFGSAPNFG